MRHKRLKLSAVLLLGLGLTGLQSQTITISNNLGVQTTYFFSNIRKITLSSSNMTFVKHNGNPDVYALNSIRNLNFIDPITSITTFENQVGTVKVFPNPVADKLEFQLSMEKSQNCALEIISILGKVVYNEKIYGVNNSYSINVSTLPKGIYLCIISNGVTVATAKFIKQ